MLQDEIRQRGVPEHVRIPVVNGEMPLSIQRAISQLWRASKYADDTGRRAWEFAVTIGELRRDGVAENELRWLVCRGYVDHADECTPTGSQRSFEHHVSLRFSEQSVFVITNAGKDFGDQLRRSMRREEAWDDAGAGYFESSEPQQASTIVHGAAPGSNGNSHPKWDRDRRELRLGTKLVKVFKLPSPMQEAILIAFEEERWPPRIDDPLPGHPDYPPKRRLHDTIKSLNRNQKNSLVRFMGDGTGEGIRWELISAIEPAEYSLLH